MKFLFYLLPLVAGIAMSVQSGVNGQLRAALGQPLMAAFLSFLSGTLTLLLLLVITRTPLPGLQQLGGIEWFKFTGGVLGVMVVTFVILSVHQVGASNMFVLIVAGQLLTALLMDHYGILGLRINPVSFQKIAGMLLVVAGAYLVTRK
jgi:bacterial/archaeal transporter family-2 protein